MILINVDAGWCNSANFWILTRMNFFEGGISH